MWHPSTSIITVGSRNIYLCLNKISLSKCCSSNVMAPPLPDNRCLLTSSVTVRNRTSVGFNRSDGHWYTQCPLGGMSDVLVSLATPYAVVLCQNLWRNIELLVSSTYSKFYLIYLNKNSKCYTNDKK